MFESLSKKLIDDSRDGGPPIIKDKELTNSKTIVHNKEVRDSGVRNKINECLECLT